jgi:hypothetical protein
VCADVPPEPRLPDGAAIPAPVTDAERLGMSAFLQWGAQLGDWARSLEVRAQKTKAWCETAS